MGSHHYSVGDQLVEIKASEARQAKRTDELRADVNRQMGELRAGNRSLGEKMDRMLDALNAVPVMDCILPDDCCPNVGHGLARAGPCRCQRFLAISLHTGGRDLMVLEGVFNNILTPMEEKLFNCLMDQSLEGPSLLMGAWARLPP